MWGGPTPHNLVTLSLCCAVRTCSEVPITSSDRDTTEAREGRPHSPSLGHPCPGAGSSFTQREVPYDWVSAPRPTPPDASWDHAGDTTHFGRNELKKKDYGRNFSFLYISIRASSEEAEPRHFMIFYSGCATNTN